MQGGRDVGGRLRPVNWSSVVWLEAGSGKLGGDGVRGTGYLQQQGQGQRQGWGAGVLDLSNG